MGDALYEHDGVLWAETQTALLRRLADGERVNEQIDWENVIDEVQDVGLNMIRTVTSLLRRAIEHLLKVHGWPEGSVEHWRDEVATFLADAADAWAPSMRQRIDLDGIYRKARIRLGGTTLYGRPPDALPERCPFTIDDLIVRDDPPDVAALLAKLRAGARA